MRSLEQAVKSGDRREALEALAEHIVNELEGNRCRDCRMSRLRTGDQAALILRLQKILEELDAMPKGDAEPTELEKIRLRRFKESQRGESA